MEILTFQPHSGGIQDGRSCNYVDKGTGNEYWLSCIPCNSAADAKVGNKYELMVFLIERGFLRRVAEFSYGLYPTATELTKDALSACKTITERFDPTP